MAALDLQSLVQAASRLEEGLERCRQSPDDAQLRDGLVQRFEFTYELSHKLLKRHLESVSPEPGEIDRLAFSDLVRTANEQGLLKGDWPAWREYREMRSRTSHTAADSSALQVVAGIPRFLEEVRHLLRELSTRRNPSD